MNDNITRYERIKAELVDTIENIFLAEQEKAKITDGGLFPETEYQINEYTNCLAAWIAKALQEQENR